MTYKRIMADSIHNDDQAKALLDRARRYCALSEQCESGVRQKLIVWGASPDMVAPIINRLRAEDYLDDERYARIYCESKIVQQHWGRQKVLYQLRLKHLPKGAIDKGMAAVSEEVYMHVLSEVAERKRAELGGIEADSRKLMSFLASRGFSLNEINKVINQ